MRTEIYEGEPRPLQSSTGLRGAVDAAELASACFWTFVIALCVALGTWMWLQEHRRDIRTVSSGKPSRLGLLVILMLVPATLLFTLVSGVWQPMHERPLTLAILGVVALLALVARLVHLPMGWLAARREALGDHPWREGAVAVPSGLFLLSTPLVLAASTALLRGGGGGESLLFLTGMLATTLLVMCLSWGVMVLVTRTGCPCSPTPPSPAVMAFTGAVTSVESCTAWKVARIRAAGPALWLEGVAGGHYGAHEEARCNRGGEHLVPDPSCTCGFHAWATRHRAESYPAELAEWCGDREAVVTLEVELGGDILQYERGFRAQFQDVLGVHLPACRCDQPATHLQPRRAAVADVMVARCVRCASPAALSLGEAASRLGVELSATNPRALSR